jgi:hypothetical protein
MSPAPANSIVEDFGAREARGVTDAFSHEEQRTLLIMHRNLLR